MLQLLAAAADNSADELYTWKTLITLPGGAVITFLVANTIGALFGFFERAVKYLRLWAAFIVAVAIQVGVLLDADADDFKAWVVAIANGVLVFTSALGLNEGADKIKVTQVPGPGPSGAGPTKPFQTSWLDR